MRHLNRNIGIFIFGCILLNLNAQDKKNEIPALKGKEEIIQHENYTLAYVEAYELALWVAYELTPEEIKGNAEYKEKFTEDPLVSTKSASMKDYKDAGYVLGQLAPVEDMLFSENAAAETFFLSNVVPMKPAFHKYTWKQIATMVRAWTNDAGSSFYVVAGPVLTDSPFPTFGPNMVSVPLRFYKVVLDIKNERGMGFVLKNSISSGSMKPYAMSIDKIEEITGIDFFPNLDDELENKIESSYDASKWDFEVVK